MPISAISVATATLIGAAVGAGIVLVGQALFGMWAAFRDRRIGAQVIYTELLANVANALPAIDGYGWSASRPEALRSAWETYGPKLLRPWNKPHDLGAISMAYNRTDDVAWLATNNHIDPKQDYSSHVFEMQAGLYVAGRWAGYSVDELRARSLPVDEIRARLKELRGIAKA